MVFTGMPYSSWKRQSQYNEEQERIFWEKESMKRKRENDFIQERIKCDLEFAKKHYQTTGNTTYSIPVNDLPKDFNNLEVNLEVNLYNLIHYVYSDDKFRFFYKTSKISFISNLTDVLNISEDIALQIHSLLSDEEYIFKSLHESWFRLYELYEYNKLFKSKYGPYAPFYKMANNSLLGEIEKLKSKSNFIKSWRNNRFWKKKGLSRKSISKLYSLVGFFYLEHDWDRVSYQKLFGIQTRGDNKF